MFGTTERTRRSTSEAPQQPVRVLLPPRVLHDRLSRLAGTSVPTRRRTWRERFLERLREPGGRRALTQVAVAALPLAAALVLLLLGVPGDASLSW
jgi:hypothetical protein